MSADPTQWYRSKVDWWLALILCVPPVAAITVCVTAALGGQTTELLVGLAILLIEVAVYFGLLLPMRYGLDATHLVVRFGICRQRVPLADISEVYPTRNPLASPAGSLDRLYIKFGRFGDAVMISPVDRNRFLDELALRAGLQREGDRLFRAASAVAPPLE